MSKIIKTKLQNEEIFALNNYENSCNNLAGVFLKKYFDDCELTNNDCYWIADQIGTVLCVNDFFFNMDFIVEAMRLKPLKQILFDYYYYELDCYSNNKERKYNLKNYISIYSK